MTDNQAFILNRAFNSHCNQKKRLEEAVSYGGQQIQNLHTTEFG
jgi:hypothetical protein